MTEKFKVNFDEVLLSKLKSTVVVDDSCRDKIKFSTELLNAGAFKKVAFDVYRVDNDPYHDLWTLETFEDGLHLVRATEDISERKEAGDWSALSDDTKDNISLYYKNIPISRFSSKDYGFSSDDIILFKSTLIEKLSTDTNFVKEVLKEQSLNKRNAILEAAPELKKFI